MASTEDLALLSLDAYSDPSVDATVHGWARQTLYAGSFANNDAGFSATVYMNSAGEYVIAFRGWDDFDEEDRDDILAAYLGNPFE